MTNEELAIQAKDGDREAMHQLWEQNQGILHILIKKLISNPNSSKRMNSAGVTMNDVYQIDYFAIVDAVKAFDPESGNGFVSYLRYPLMNQFFALIGMHTKRDRQDPLSQCQSLDELVGSEDGQNEGITRADMVPDPNAEQDFENVEDRLYCEHIHNTLEECMQHLKDREAQVLRGRYYQKWTLDRLGKDLGISPGRVHQLELSAMRKMRGQKKLSEYREQIICTYAYRGTGFNAWKYGGSVEERTVEKLERLEL